MEEKKRELAYERTDLAIQRTILANARTFSAWIRTGLSSVLAGLGIVKFIGYKEEFHGYVLSIGILFVLTGIAIYIMALISYKRSLNELKKEEDMKVVPLSFLIVITTGMVLTATLIMGFLIFS